MTKCIPVVFHSFEALVLCHYQMSAVTTITKRYTDAGERYIPVVAGDDPCRGTGEYSS